MDALEAIAAEIIAGALAYRQARVLLALARSGGVMGARQIAEQTGIDRAHVLRALAELAEAGWVVRDKSGARLAPEAVDKRVPKEHTGCVPKEHTCAEKAHAHDSDAPAPLLGKQELSTGQDWHDSCRISSSSSYKTTTTTTTTTTPRVPKEHTPAPAPARELIWPQCLHESLRDKAQALLGTLEPGMAQELLDELSGRAALHPIANPLAYLQSLAARARAGEFVAVAGVSIAEGRRRQAEMRARMEEQRAALTREAAAGGNHHAATR